MAIPGLTDESNAYGECERTELDYDGTPIVQSMVRTGEYRLHGAEQSWPEPEAMPLIRQQLLCASNDDALALEPEIELVNRVARARRHALRALEITERGHSMPYAALERCLESIVAELGCVSCGKRLRDADVRDYATVRKHGCHVTDRCFEMAQDGGAL